MSRIMTVTTELLTISALKEEGFKSNLKSREGVSLPPLPGPGPGADSTAGGPESSLLGLPSYF